MQLWYIINVKNNANITFQYEDSISHDNVNSVNRNVLPNGLTHSDAHHTSTMYVTKRINTLAISNIPIDTAQTTEWYTPGLNLGFRPAKERRSLSLAWRNAPGAVSI